MAVGLKKQRRWWIGPVLLPLDAFTRIAGPEPDMEFRATQEAWDAHVAEIMAANPDELPPVIGEYVGRATLRLCDGSHRHEAMRRRGGDSIWALIWCNTESDFLIASPVYGGDRRVMHTSSSPSRS